MRSAILTLVISAIVSGQVVAAEPLEKTEIMRILEILTGRPRKTWILSGIISARHERYRAPQTREPSEISRQIDQKLHAYLSNPSKAESTEKLRQMRIEAIPFNVRYRLANEYSMNSKETVKIDGNRFYWEIEVDSRVDSVILGPELADNYLTREFDLGLNKKRLFVWDGEKYIRYFRPINQAIITSDRGEVNGPLTAGIIPWGYGEYSLENLNAAQISGSEVELDGHLEVQLKVVNGNKQETFVLDPDKNYSVKSYSETVENSYIVRNYSEYRLVDEQWCPGLIIAEQYDTSVIPPSLSARDIWEFFEISYQQPSTISFDISYDYDALIEDYRFSSDPLQFRYLAPEQPSARRINVEELQRNRLEIADSAEVKSQNCATLSLKYVCEKLGKSPSWQQLRQLVHGDSKRTSMLEIQQFVGALGLGSIVGKSDIDSLRALDDDQIILHLPVINHYVVLGVVDDEYVHLIDLDSQNFYYRVTIDHFNEIWKGTTLVINDKPLTISGNFAKIIDSELRGIFGAANCEDCTKKIQSFWISHCEASGAGCTSNVIIYTRYGCESASSGNCSEESLLSSQDEQCIHDDDLNCVGCGEWTSYNIQACQ